MVIEIFNIFLFVFQEILLFIFIDQVFNMHYSIGTLIIFFFKFPLYEKWGKNLILY